MAIPEIKFSHHIYLHGVDIENLTFAFTELDMNFMPDSPINP